MSVGFCQLILIFLMILLLFGSGKLPKVMKELGEGLKAMKKAVKEDDDKNDSEKNVENSDKKNL